VARWNQEESRRAERERAAREDQMVARWRADRDAERRGTLFSRKRFAQQDREAEAC
jgi:hypothetical protein